MRKELNIEKHQNLHNNTAALGTWWSVTEDLEQKTFGLSRGKQ